MVNPDRTHCAGGGPTHPLALEPWGGGVSFWHLKLEGGGIAWAGVWHTPLPFAPQDPLFCVFLGASTAAFGATAGAELLRLARRRRQRRCIAAEAVHVEVGPSRPLLPWPTAPHGGGEGETLHRAVFFCNSHVLGFCNFLQFFLQLFY